MGKPISQTKRYNEEKKWEDELDIYQFPPDKMVLVRMVGDVEILARHWIETLSQKRFPAWCPRLDADENFDHSRPCPAHQDFPDTIRAQKVILGNMIVRSLQERGDPEPVRSFFLPHAANEDLLQIAELIHADPADLKKGVDLAIKYSPKTPGNKKWTIQRGDTTPLTKEELGYRYPELISIVPDFSDPEVATQYAKKMKEGMARHKWYVVQEANVPSNARDPYKYFRGDVNGDPRTEFAVLTPSGKEDEPEPPRRRQFRERDAEDPRPEGQRRQAEPASPTPPKQAAWDPDDDDDLPGDLGNNPPAKEAPAKQDASGDPECFAQYDGTSKCMDCAARSRCIDATDDDL